MPLGVNAHPGAWLDGVAVAGQDLRLQLAGAMLTGASPSGTTGIAARPGVRYGTGSPLLVQASSGMNVTVNAGVAFVQGTASATAGMYTCCLDTTATLTAATSDPTNPRIDNVICQITDVGSSSSTTVVTIQTGTPAPSPVAPTLPANSLLLATIAVGAGVSSITAGNITDSRVYTAASGGIVPMANTTGGISGQAGLYAHDLSTGRLRVSDGSGNARTPKVGAFAPVSAGAASSPYIYTSTYSAIVSVSVTVDGATEVELLCSWLGFGQNPSPTAGSQLSNKLYMDGSWITDSSGQGFVWNYTKTWAGDTGNGGECGGCFRAVYTPAAGTHTFAWMGSSLNSNMYVDRAALRVAPSVQQ